MSFPTNNSPQAILDWLNKMENKEIFKILVAPSHFFQFNELTLLLLSDNDNNRLYYMLNQECIRDKMFLLENNNDETAIDTFCLMYYNTVEFNKFITLPPISFNYCVRCNLLYFAKFIKPKIAFKTKLINGVAFKHIMRFDYNVENKLRLELHNFCSITCKNGNLPVLQVNNIVEWLLESDEIVVLINAIKTNNLAKVNEMIMTAPRYRVYYILSMFPDYVETLINSDQRYYYAYGLKKIAKRSKYFMR